MSQPLLHDSVVLLSAPSQAWSGADGTMGGAPIHGFFHSDTRIFTESPLRIGGECPTALSHGRSDAATGTFVGLARCLDDGTADPKVRVNRTRRLADGSLHESIELASALPTEISTTIRIELLADFAQMQTIKAGTATPEPAVRVRLEPDAVHLDAGETTAVVSARSAQISRNGAAGVTLSWDVAVPPRGSVTVDWSVTVSDTVAGRPAVTGRTAVVAGATDAPEWADARLSSGDSRLGAWVTTALQDLTALRMVRSEARTEPFLAAGAPWFFTLFGRDSIWAARFLLPLGTELAASTLRVLAGLQGVASVPSTAEQPGKIMHELRPSALSIPGEDVLLPPLYFGTVDSTALWVCLLHEAWTWGMADGEVEALLPNLEAALAWMRDYGDSDGDGFLEYVDTTGHGLANQGWKDSGDSIQWRDGRLAEGPIALCEVQAYAYQAAVGGAKLLDSFGRPGGDTWRAWAAALKERFAASFWIDSPGGAYPAVALDARKLRVDAVTSNIGHLLGTGILDHAESALVARRLASPELDSGYGLRTMSTEADGYWPLSYHGGSVWAHDTAIAIAGLGRAGFAAEAGSLIDGLLAAAAGFGYRMPELHSGDSPASAHAPIPYPAACRPQAWSAAAAVSVLGTLLGLKPEAGAVSITPLPGSGLIEVDGLRYAGHPFAVSTDADGRVVRNTQT